MEKTALKVVGTIATGFFFSAVTGGAGLPSYLYGLGAATGLNIGLDSKVRKNIAQGNFGEAANLASYHMPFVGPGRRMWEAAKQGDSLGMLFNSGMLLAEGAGMKFGMKAGKGGKWLGGKGEGASSTSLTKVIAEEIKSLPVVRTNLGTHCIERCVERGITKKMAEKAIEKGVRYYDPLNKSIVYVLEKGMASGDHLMLAVEPSSGLLKTIFTRSKPIHKRLIPLD